MEGCVMYGNQCTAMCEQTSADYAFALARWAKAELLREKVKQRFNGRYGEKLDRLADLIVEVVAERAKNSERYGEREEALEGAFDEVEE